MKKLITLVVLLSCFLGTKAAWVEVYKIVYSDYTSFPFYVMGYTPTFVNGIMTDDGANQDPAVTGWHQYFIADHIPTEVGKNYTVKALVKSSADLSFNINMGWGWGDGEQAGVNVTIPQSEDFVEVTWSYEGIDGTSCNLVAQPWSNPKIEWKQLVVGYESTDPVVEKNWYTILEDDCSTATNFCVKYFKNYVAATATDGAIVAQSLTPEQKYPEYYSGADTTAVLTNDWDTQFFIKLPVALPNNTKVRFSMRCKADKVADGQPQSHGLPVVGKVEGQDGYSGTYIDSNLFGNNVNVSFQTNWSTYYKEFKAKSNANIVMQSICFNLEALREVNKYYFDDIIVAVELTEEEAAEIPGAKALNIPLTVDATAGYATFVPAMDVVIPEEGLKVYTATLSEDQKYVTLTPITGSIKAGTPVIVEGSTQNLEVTTGAAAASNNNLKVSDGTVKGDGKSIYVLANGNDGVGFYKLAKDASVPKGKAYLQVAAVESREFIAIAGEATGIKNVENQKKSGIIYNLAGQQVKNAKKGLYIIDGKKVIK